MDKIRYYSDITRQSYSERKFLDLIEKRIRKHLRIEKSINLKNKYFIINDDTANYEVMIYFLKRILPEKLDLITITTGEDLKADDREQIKTEHLETYLADRMDFFMKNKPLETLEKTISPLRVVSEKELEVITRILSIDKKIDTKKNKFIEELQETYEQTKTSLLKSFDNIAEQVSKKR